MQLFDAIEASEEEFTIDCHCNDRKEQENQENFNFLGRKKDFGSLNDISVSKKIQNCWVSLEFWYISSGMLICICLILF